MHCVILEEPMINISIRMLNPTKAIELPIAEESFADHVLVDHHTQPVRYRCLVNVYVWNSHKIAK